MKSISVCFFGTHDFATRVLDGLFKSTFLEIKLVITQPDKPVGRKQELKKSQVKILAEKLGLQIQQPESLKSYRLPPTRLAAGSPRRTSYELGIVAQYGLLIPPTLIQTFPHGILNVHTSLLPRYRGASPIQSALMHGDIKTGVTIMQLDAGLDTGPIGLQKEIEIDPDDTARTLEKKLAHLGVEALLEAIPPYIDKTLLLQPQDETKVTLCKPLTRDDGRVDWKKTAAEIYNQFRGLTPWPGLWTTIDGKRVKLLSVTPSKESRNPGEISLRKERIMVGSGHGSLIVHCLQFEGKKPMKADDMYHGYAHLNGHSFI